MENYTTAALIAADKTGTEVKKTEISKDAYAIVEFLDKLNKQLELNRVSI